MRFWNTGKPVKQQQRSWGHGGWHQAGHEISARGAVFIVLPRALQRDLMAAEREQTHEGSAGMWHCFPPVPAIATSQELRGHIQNVCGGQESWRTSSKDVVQCSREIDVRQHVNTEEWIWRTLEKGAREDLVATNWSKRLTWRKKKKAGPC